MWDKTLLTLRIAHLLFALAAVMMLYAGFFLVINLPVFPLRKIDVNGHLDHVNREQVKLIVQQEMKGNFFTLDIKRIRGSFEKLPWVRTVNVRRRWPDRLEVALEEHQALARWGGIGLVNTRGEVFQAASDGDLPEFIGPTPESAKDITEHYGLFKATLAPLGLPPVQMVLSPRRAWQVRLKNGLTLELGREEVEARMSRFAEVYDRTVAKLPASVNYVDLRYPNGFAVRYPELATRKATGTNKQGAKHG
ncbi:MAG: cell division protein FtsQ/DivIB [Sulfuricella sp.]|nr:cell division protein FtsQ/DivIB [Sulfuricella sp.]